MARGGGGARGGGKGGKGGTPLTRDVIVSKKLSWLLRHGAEKEGLKLGRGGYANLADVLQNRNIRSLQPPPTLSEIKELVADNAKQRFSLVHVSVGPPEDAKLEFKSSTLPESTSNVSTGTDDDPSKYLIRANQGHSLKLESGADDLLTPITAEAGNVPQMVVHGTRRDHWEKIVDSGGLKTMGRNHVHFATGLPDSIKSALAKSNPATPQQGKGKTVEPSEIKKDPSVVSGMRELSTIVMFLDLRKAMDKGLIFYLSENGVVLCEGNENGIIELGLFQRVEDRNGQVLVQDGKIVGSIPPRKARPETQHEGIPKGFPTQRTLPIRDKKSEAPVEEATT